MTDRAGIKSDYCPQCRGVGLDRGELDTIVERSSTEARPRDFPPMDSPRGGNHGSDRDWDRGELGARRRKDWLGELFD